MHVNQITRNQQEGGHVESIYDTFGIRILTSYMAQVKDDHEYDKQAFQIVQFMDTVLMIVSDKSMRYRKNCADAVSNR